MEVHVHPRIERRHPELGPCDVQKAWRSYAGAATRKPGERELRVGFDELERELEMIGVLTTDGWLAYHAMTPPSCKTMREVEQALRRRWRWPSTVWQTEAR